MTVPLGQTNVHLFCAERGHNIGSMTSFLFADSGPLFHNKIMYSREALS